MGGKRTGQDKGFYKPRGQGRGGETVYTSGGIPPLSRYSSWLFSRKFSVYRIDFNGPTAGLPHKVCCFVRCLPGYQSSC